MKNIDLREKNLDGVKGTVIGGEASNVGPVTGSNTPAVQEKN